MRYVPGILGAVLLVAGLALIMPALGVAAAGALLLALDSRLD